MEYCNKCVRPIALCLCEQNKLRVYEQTLFYIREKLNSGGAGTRSQVSEAVNKALELAKEQTP